MEPAYYIYSIRMQGWINQTGTAGTDRSAAKHFRYAEAIEYCRERLSHEGASTCFPVPSGMLSEVEQKL